MSAHGGTKAALMCVVAVGARVTPLFALSCYARRTVLLSDFESGNGNPLKPLANGAQATHAAARADCSSLLLLLLVRRQRL